jgi:hypothetical protein
LAKNAAHFETVVIIVIAVPEACSNPIITEIDQLNLKSHLLPTEFSITQYQASAFNVFCSVRCWESSTLLVYRSALAHHRAPRD